MDTNPNLNVSTADNPGEAAGFQAPGQVIAPAAPAPAQPVPTPAISYNSTSAPSSDRPLGVAQSPPPSGVFNHKAVDSSGTGSPPKRRLIKKTILVPVLAALVLLGGGAAAYFGYVVPSKPQNVLARAVSNSLRQTQFTTQGTINLTASGISSKLDYTTAVDETSHSLDTKLNATISGVNIPLELISTKGNVYFKVGDLSSLYGLLNQTLGGAVPDIQKLETQINQNITSQWFIIDSTLIKEAKLDCLTNYPAPFTQADVNSLNNSYKSSPFVTISSHSADTVNGSAAIKYVLSVNDNTLAKMNLTSTGYFKSLQACIQQSSPATKLDLSSSKDDDSTPLTLWVDKKTKQIVKYSSQSTAKDKTKGVIGDLTGTVTYGSVNVVVPSGAKPILSLLNQLNLGDLASSFGAGPVVGSPAAADTERKTDISALQGHLEAYWATNGFYPTLAQVNDATWRATNFQGLDANALKDPGGTEEKLFSAPAVHVYAYQPTPAGCDNLKTKCQDYTLTATLDAGSTYVKHSLNSSSNLPGNVN